MKLLLNNFQAAGIYALVIANGWHVISLRFDGSPYQLIDQGTRGMEDLRMRQVYIQQRSTGLSIPALVEFYKLNQCPLFRDENEIGEISSDCLLIFLYFGNCQYQGVRL